MNLNLFGIGKERQKTEEEAALEDRLKSIDMEAREKEISNFLETMNQRRAKAESEISVLLPQAQAMEKQLRAMMKKIYGLARIWHDSNPSQLVRIKSRPIVLRKPGKPKVFAADDFRLGSTTVDIETNLPINQDGYIEKTIPLHKFLVERKEWESSGWKTKPNEILILDEPSPDNSLIRPAIEEPQIIKEGSRFKVEITFLAKYPPSCALPSQEELQTMVEELDQQE